MTKAEILTQRFARLHQRYVAPYSIISKEPVILHLPIYVESLESLNNSYKILFEFLKEKTVYLLCNWGSYLEREKDVERFEVWQKEFIQTYKNFKLIHLCNTEKQLEIFKKYNMDGIFCNHNCFADESIFYPRTDVEKIFDAVYDARLSIWKRHYLAAKIEKLALIYYILPLEDSEFAAHIKEKLSGAEFFNHAKTEEYTRLTIKEVNEYLNLCRVGLCLSEEEGAMYASVQYLLCGLPVVTTPNCGGRDEFFDNEYVLTVKPDADAVEKGVKKLIERNLPPDEIRQKTLKKMYRHRERFINLIQSIYNREKCDRNFADEFGEMFFNRMLKNQNHIEAIELIENTFRNQ
ncbi:MAG: glycosyltransferase [Pyrinomonadaceae bacterium]